MAVLDVVRRRGIDGKRVVAGPSQLSGPRSGDVKSDLYRLGGIYGTVDLYEVGTGAGTGTGTYSFTVGPYAEDGFAASHRSIRDVIVFHQIGGVANPAAPVTCLVRKRPYAPDGGLVLGPYATNTGDRLWVAIEQRDESTLKYQLSVDAELEPGGPPEALACCYILSYGNTDDGDWGWEYINSASVDSQGNTIFAVDQYNYDIESYLPAIVKLAPDGSPAWLKRFRRTSDIGTYSYAWEVFHIGDDEFLLSIKGGGTNLLPAVMKCDSDGEILWQRKFSLQSAYDNWVSYNDSCLDSAGNLVICGAKTGPEIEGYAIFLAKISEDDGSLMWATALHSGSESDFHALYGVAVDASNDDAIYACGLINFAATPDQYGIVRFDQDGAIQWQKAFDVPYTVVLNDITVAATGVIVCAGYVNNPDLQGLLAVSDDEGAITQVWAVDYEAPPELTSHEMALAAITHDAEGQIYAVGRLNEIDEAGIYRKILLLKVDPGAGEVVWARTIFGSWLAGINDAWTVRVDGDCVTITGYGNGLNNVNDDGLLIRIGTNGYALGTYGSEEEGAPGYEIASIEATLSSLEFSVADGELEAVDPSCELADNEFTVEEGDLLPQQLLLLNCEPPEPEPGCPRYILHLGFEEEEAYGWEYFNAGVLDAEGNAILAYDQYDYETEEYGAGIIKISRTGEVMWYKSMQDADPGFVFANSIAAAPDGSLYISDSRFGPASFFKFDATGANVWQYQTQNSITRRLVAASDNSFYVLGSHTDGEETLAGAALVMKISSAGAQLWSALIDTPGIGDTWLAGAVDSEDNICVAGSLNDYDGEAPQDPEASIAFYDAAGVLQWKKRFTGEPATYVAHDYFMDLISDGADEFIGCSKLYGELILSDYQSLVWHLSASGSVDWAYQVSSGESGAFWAKAIAQDSAGDLIIGGSFTDGDGVYWWAIVKMSPAGEMIWARRFGGELPYGFNDLFEVMVDADDCIVAAGYVEGFGELTDQACLLRLDSDGSGLGAYFSTSEAGSGVELADLEILITEFELSTEAITTDEPVVMPPWAESEAVEVEPDLAPLDLIPLT